MRLKFNGSGVYRGNGLALSEAQYVEVEDELGEYLLRDYPKLFDVDVEVPAEAPPVKRGPGRPRKEK